MVGVCSRLDETSEGVGWEGTSEREGGRREEEGDWGKGSWGVGWEGWGGGFWGGCEVASWEGGKG